MGAHGNSAPWDGIGSTGNARTRERTGRLSFGGKGKRKTVTATGVPVAQTSDSEWCEAHGIKPQPRTRYGTGATVRDVERGQGMHIPEHAALAGARQTSEPMKAEGYGIVSPLGEVKLVGGLRYRDAGFRQVPMYRALDRGSITADDKAIQFFRAPAHIVRPEDNLRTFKAKPDPRDRIAREQVAAEQSHGKAKANADKAAKRIYAKLRKVLGG